jgi:hypothetical protein
VNLEDGKGAGSQKVVDKPTFAAQQPRRKKVFSTYELLLFSVNEKCMTKPTVGEHTSECKKNIYCGYRPCEAWLQSDGLLTATVNTQCLNPELQHRRCTTEQ